MIHYIYKITNQTNGDKFIGIHSTNNLDDGHFGSGIEMEHAIQQYGQQNFKREIMAHFTSFESMEYFVNTIINTHDKPQTEPQAPQPELEFLKDMVEQGTLIVEKEGYRFGIAGYELDKIPYEWAQAVDYFIKLLRKKHDSTKKTTKKQPQPQAPQPGLEFLKDMVEQGSLIIESEGYGFFITTRQLTHIHNQWAQAVDYFIKLLQEKQRLFKKPWSISQTRSSIPTTNLKTKAQPQTPETQPELEFLDDMVEQGTLIVDKTNHRLVIPSEQLTKLYNQWAQKNNKEPMTTTKFVRRLREKHGFKKSRHLQKMCVLGISKTSN